MPSDARNMPDSIKGGFPDAIHPSGEGALGVVSFLNALPLYARLKAAENLTVIPDVPSQLLRLVLEKRCTAALLPVAAYWGERQRLAMISDGCIASDGETMTVRVFSRVPPDQMTGLYVDSDSRTSVVLARLLWLELYGRGLEIIPWVHGEDPHQRAVEALLLIGDKVVTHRPRGFGFEVDLGAAWKHLTGLPFVFAAWFAEQGRDHSALAATLRLARDAGVADVEQIVREHASRHGWPSALALTYLRDTMCYTLTETRRAGLERFFELAGRHGLLP